ncbi:hypothetical protein E4U42_002146, partial [Claviceps africana]
MPRLTRALPEPCLSPRPCLHDTAEPGHATAGVIVAVLVLCGASCAVLVCLRRRRRRGERSAARDSTDGEMYYGEGFFEKDTASGDFSAASLSPVARSRPAPWGFLASAAEDGGLPAAPGPV